MTKAQHTLLPSTLKYEKYRQNGQPGYRIYVPAGDALGSEHVAFVTAHEPYAAFIVRACNAHYELLGLVKEYAASNEPVSLYQDADYQKRIRTTIAKVEGAA